MKLIINPKYYLGFEFIVITHSDRYIYNIENNNNNVKSLLKKKSETSL